MTPIALAAYSSAEVLAIIAAVAALVSTLGVAIVNIVVALRTNRKIDVNTQMTEEVSAKADVITTHVNGAATAAAEKIEQLQREADTLRAALADHKQTAAVLAAAVAGRLDRQHRATDPDPLDPKAPEPLKVEVVNTPLRTVTEKA